MAKQPVKTVTTHSKFQQFRRWMNENLLERTEEIDICLTALLCGENPLFIGPPGTGKSYMLDLLRQFLNTNHSFKKCLTKFTVPEEVCGPMSVSDMLNDRFRRVTTGKLPEAEVVYLDEIWKASSAILNTLLTILNEKEFENDGFIEKCPLLICMAASNEWPQGEEVGALFDRFLFRKTVDYCKEKESRTALLGAKVFETDVPQEMRISNAELKQAKNDVADMAMTQQAIDALDRTLDQLDTEGIHPGDRRIYKAARALQAYAWLVSDEGNCNIYPEHLTILSHVLWVDPGEQPKKCRQIVWKNSNPTAHNINELLLQAADVYKKTTPVEAVPKLQEIQDQIRKLPSMNPTDKLALHNVLQKVQQWTGLAYDNVIKGRGK